MTSAESGSTMKHRRKLVLLSILSFALVLVIASACTTPDANGNGDNSSTGDSQNGMVATDPSNGNAGGQDLQASDEGLSGVVVPHSALLSAEEVMALREADSCRIIDVRTFAEYTVGSIPESVSIPLSFLTRRYTEIPRDMKNVLLTSNEEDMARAYEILLSLDFSAENLFFLEGGLDAWEAAGYQIQVNYGTGC